MSFRRQITFHVAQFGRLDRAQVENAVGLAKLVQDGFELVFLHDSIAFSDADYRLQNGGYDLDKAVVDVVVPKALPNPLILFTSLPYGDPADGDEPDYFYFSGHYPGDIMLVSTYWWDTMQGSSDLQPYILMMLSATLLGYVTDLQYHSETASCLFDYCNDVQDQLRVFEGSGLCKVCEQALMKKLHAGTVSGFQVAAAIRIFDRAKRIRRCFLAMPFSRNFRKIHEVVARSVSAGGWLVVRGDEIARPRHITDAIFQAIQTSDLVVADITDNNPNVFYEPGFAHAAGCDIIMLCQQSTERLPFDVAHDRTVFYKATEAGLKKLESELRDLVTHA